MISQASCKITKESQCKNFAYEIFDNIDELVEANRARPHLRNQDRMNMDKEIESNSSWYQCSSYKEAENLALNGWKGLLEKSEFTDFYKVNKGYADKMFKTKNDVVGFAPIVANVLKGIPQSMINVDKKRVRSKIIHIAYNISCTAGRNGRTIMEAGFKVMSAIVDLEKQGYRIRLTAIQDFTDKRLGCDVMMIKVKDENKKLDLYSSMFALTHTAVFRLLGFAWHERSPVCRDLGDGYGTTFYNAYNGWENFHNDIKNILKDKNTVLINAQDLTGGKYSYGEDLTVEDIEKMILEYGRSYNIEKEADVGDAC